MLSSESRSFDFLALLLGGALALSLALNALLLKARLEEWPEDVGTEQAATTTSLYATQRSQESGPPLPPPPDSLRVSARNLASGTPTKQQ